MSWTLQCVRAFVCACLAPSVRARMSGTLRCVRACVHVRYPYPEYWVRAPREKRARLSYRMHLGRGAQFFLPRQGDRPGDMP